MEFELYKDESGKYSDWVKRNILKNLKGPKVSRKNAAGKINKFVGKKKPYAISFVPHYDAVYLNKLFGANKHPFHFMFIDFASILSASGIDPENYFKKAFLKKIGVNTKIYKHTHNALDDARLLREVFIKFFKIKLYEKAKK